MKIILSPAKKMIVDTDNIAPVELPAFIDKTAEILSWMKSKSKEELKAIWKCNDKIAEQNFNRLENMDLYNRLTPAVLAYEGIAFQYMAPSVFEIQQFEYLQNHLRILSARKFLPVCSLVCLGHLLLSLCSPSQVLRSLQRYEKVRLCGS